jgi:hypothetical protein
MSYVVFYTDGKIETGEGEVQQEYTELQQIEMEFSPAQLRELVCGYVEDGDVEALGYLERMGMIFDDDLVDYARSFKQFAMAAYLTNLKK